jgi:hypothetical protein
MKIKGYSRIQAAKMKYLIPVEGCSTVDRITTENI